MILKDKIAVIYGAGGSLGGAFAKAFAAAGAHVFLTGIHSASVETTAMDIRSAGGQAETAVVDGFDAKAIETHLQSIVRQTGRIDISFNAVGIDVKQGVPLVDLDPEEYLDPVANTLRTRFLTAKAAAKIMIGQGGGVILTLTATPAGIGYPYTGGFSAACTAVECMVTNLASELGIHGIRVVNLRSGGSPDSRVFQEVIERAPQVMEPVLHQMKEDTMLKKLPLMADIANVAAFVASDLARAITGVTVDLTCGTTAALNYRAKPSDVRPSFDTP